MIANGFYQNLSEIDPAEIEFVCFGIPRSGSTLVYQLISGCYAEGVAKTHQYCDHRVKTLVSFRDFRDAVVSLWRRSNPRNSQRQMRESEIDEFATLCLQRVKALDRYFERDDICRLRYEDFVGDSGLIFSLAAKAFGIVFDPQKVCELVDKYSLAKNRQIADRLKNFHDVDETTLIHGNHIFSANVGDWREFVEPGAAQKLESLLRGPLTKYGYE